MIDICKAIYGNERGAALQSYLEGAMGHPCPCRQGRVCPLMPQDEAAEDVAEAAIA